MRQTATMRWCDAAPGGRGYGFAALDATTDVYVHVTALRDPSARERLQTGTRIDCEVVGGPRGFAARDIIVLD